MGNAIIAMIDLVDGAVESVLHIEAEFGGDFFDGGRGWAFDFGVGREMGPGVDGDFDAVKMPNFAEGFLAGFEAETGRLENGDGVVIVADGDIALVDTGEGEIGDLFEGHDDSIAFVTDAEKGMGPGIKNDAAHEGFGFDAGGTKGFKLCAVGGFVDVEEAGFVFFAEHMRLF